MRDYVGDSCRGYKRNARRIDHSSYDGDVGLRESHMGGGGGAGGIQAVYGEI